MGVLGYEGLVKMRVSGSEEGMPLSYLDRQAVWRGTDVGRFLVPTPRLARQSDIGAMTSSHTPDGKKPPPVEKSYTSLKGVFQQALDLELMLAQKKLVKDAAQTPSIPDPV